ncbi:MFS transporter [Actinoplanes sp. NPDC049681]|uniref:MFS transporter n=1 Tax=Actinoplanes sp. NPDC049681 TaxID=3363905 RepID=UPI00378FFB9D
MGESPARYRDVFAVREYRHLFGANVLSLIGDQLTAIALAFTVFERSHSSTLAAITFAVTYATWIIGGPALSVLADRFPRRTVMLTCDLARAGLVLSLAVPGIPIPALLGVALLTNMFRPPFQAARASLMPDLLDGDRYPVANGLDNIVGETTQVLGFAVGGILVAAASARGVLLVDSATFVASALLIATGLRGTVASAPPAEAPSTSRLADMAAGARVVFSDRRLRSYLLLFWFSCLVYGAEGVAAPLSKQYGGGAFTGGLILAAMPLGVAVGGVFLTRGCPPALRQRLTVPLAVVSCAALVPVAAHPPLPVLLALLIASGLAGAFSIPLNAIFGRAVPAAYRARAFGVAMSGVCAVQGLAMIGAGAAAERLAPTTVVGGAGLLATLSVVAVAARWPRQPTDQHAPARPLRVAAQSSAA